MGDKVTWIGKPIPRREDRVLTRGAGRYVADVQMPGMLHMAILRSPHAHARIESIDVEAARNLPGVHQVFTAAEMPARLSPLPVIWNVPGQQPGGMVALAKDKVRYVGEGVAVVVAETAAIAEDARELIDVRYERLPAVVDVEEAMNPDAPVVNEEWGSNIAARCPFKAGDTDAAFAAADVVVSARVKMQRHMCMPMETRGLVASWDDLTETLTVWSQSQASSLLAAELSKSLALGDSQIRVMSPNIGGAFGGKWDRYAEDLLVCVAAMELKRPVKWIEDRREHFQAFTHARDQTHDWELALTSEGKILGLRGTLYCDMGAQLPSAGIGAQWVSGNTMPNMYKFENYTSEIIAVCTNKVGTGSYRGFGGPEGNFAMERMMEKAARKLNMDPAELRRINLVQPEDMPYGTASGAAFLDSGDYPEALRRALEMVGYDKIRAEQPELRKQGIYRGVGVVPYVHCTGFGPSAMLGMIGYMTSGYEGSRITVDRDGRVTVFTGMVPIGQGAETALIQVAADSFGIDMEQVRVVWGDTFQTPYTGFGSGGSRGGLMVAAALNATEEIKQKMQRIAAHQMEVDVADVEFGDGEVRVKGAPETSMAFEDIAMAAHMAHNLPEGEQPLLLGHQVFDPPGFGWAYGVHVGVVDVDIATGQVTWGDYVVVDDCGPMVNPLIVHGQMIGGAVQAIGGALLEEVTYDESGQLVTASFMDYLMPSFHDVPKEFKVEHMITPTPFVPGGFKGVGEGGIMAPYAVAANAISDALHPFGVEFDELPITPPKIWRALDEAGAYDSVSASA